MNDCVILKTCGLRLLLFVLLHVVCIDVYAQLKSENGAKINTDSLHRDVDKAPWFRLYKDNYFIFGPSIGPKATKENTNVKFQISISQRLTKTTLPFKTYLYLFYSQKCIWNVLEKSLPMTDMNFNPGLGLAHPLIKDGRFVGVVQLAIEHESNGKDSIQSRSWNRISIGGSIMVTPNVVLHGKAWLPIVDGENNKDLLKYVGLFQVGVSYSSSDRKYGASIMFVKRKTWKPDFNTVIELSYRMFRSANQYFFLQYYNGYGENLLDYNQFRSQLRVGIVIKPKLFSEY